MTVFEECLELKKEYSKKVKYYNIPILQKYMNQRFTLDTDIDIHELCVQNNNYVFIADINFIDRLLSLSLLEFNDIISGIDFEVLIKEGNSLYTIFNERYKDKLGHRLDEALSYNEEFLDEALKVFTDEKSSSGDIHEALLSVEEKYSQYI